MDCILPEVDRRGADQMFLAYGKAIDDQDEAFIDDNAYETRMKFPANPHGLIFFHSLRIGERYPVPRLRSGRTLSDRSFRYLFGIDFIDIDESFFRSNSIQRLEAPLRSNNKRRRTKRYIAPDDAPQENLFYLRVRGVELLPPILDDGSDLEDEGSEDEGRGQVQDVDKQLTDLWRQFIYDITQMVPNRKSANEDGYCKLSSEERAIGGDGLYKNLCLSDFFNDCQWKRGNDDDWNSAFNHLFPLQDKTGKKQNYKQGSYLKAWNSIRDAAVDEEALKTIRRALRSRFSALLWFPCPQGDRIWATRRYESMFKKFVNPESPAPWVICRRDPSWN
jgi:hypothetical protein